MQKWYFVRKSHRKKKCFVQCCQQGTLIKQLFKFKVFLAAFYCRNNFVVAIFCMNTIISRFLLWCIHLCQYYFNFNRYLCYHKFFKTLLFSNAIYFRLFFSILFRFPFIFYETFKTTFDSINFYWIMSNLIILILIF